LAFCAGLPGEDAGWADDFEALCSEHGCDLMLGVCGEVFVRLVMDDLVRRCRQTSTSLQEMLKVAQVFGAPRGKILATEGQVCGNGALGSTVTGPPPKTPFAETLPGHARTELPSLFEIPELEEFVATCNAEAFSLSVEKSICCKQQNLDPALAGVGVVDEDSRSADEKAIDCTRMADRQRLAIHAVDNSNARNINEGDVNCLNDSLDRRLASSDEDKYSRDTNGSIVGCTGESVHRTSTNHGACDANAINVDEGSLCYKTDSVARALASHAADERDVGSSLPASQVDASWKMQERMVLAEIDEFRRTAKARPARRRQKLDGAGTTQLPEQFDPLLGGRPEPLPAVDYASILQDVFNSQVQPPVPG